MIRIIWTRRITEGDMKIVILILLFSLLLGRNLANAAQYQMVRVYLHSATELERLIRLGIDLEGSRYKKNLFIDLQISESEIKLIRENGNQIDILIEDL
jgi:hypothetical protein